MNSRARSHTTQHNALKTGRSRLPPVAVQMLLPEKSLRHRPRASPHIPALPPAPIHALCTEYIVFSSLPYVYSTRVATVERLSSFQIPAYFPRADLMFVLYDSSVNCLLYCKIDQHAMFDELAKINGLLQQRIYIIILR